MENCNDAETSRLVQDSFAKVALTSEAAAMLFYDRLFDIARRGQCFPAI
jgi:hypothetical protein